MNKDKLLIFDLDGTLFRTETVDVEAVNRALGKNGFETKDQEEITELIGEPLDIFVRKLTSSTDEQALIKLKEDIIDFEVKLIPEHGEMYPNVLNILAKLKMDGFTLCICTNGNKRYVEAITEKYCLKNYFHDIVYKRPQYNKIQVVSLLKGKYQKDITVVIGDRDTDFLASKENSCISIAVTYGFGKKEELEMADYIASSIDEVEDIIRKI